MHEALKMTYVSRFMGSDSNSLLQIRDDTQKGPGDRVRNILRMQLSGTGIQGDNTLEGQEEALITYTDDLLIDQVRHAVRSGGKMSEQRVPFSVREESRMSLTDWWADRFDQWFFNQIAGNAAETRTLYTGNNTCTSPDSNHIIFAGSASAETGLSANTSQTFSLEVIDRAVLAARTTTPVIRPINNQQEPGRHQYVMFITPEQHYDLRRSVSAGDWGDITKYRLSSGEIENNPLLSGSIGQYNGVVLHESWRLPTGADGDSVADGRGRAVLCGAQAAVLAFGRDHGPNRMSWVIDWPRGSATIH